MEYRFFLDEVIYEDPINWDDFELSMSRDDNMHGMQFEASTGTLTFEGDGAAYLKNKKDTEGQFANVIFRAEINCDGETWEEIYRGRLNFGKYKAKCGITCTVSIPAEEDSCAVTFKSRYDQKVDLDSRNSFGNISLPDYAMLGVDIELLPKALQVGVIGSVEELDVFDLQTSGNGIDHTIVRPTYLAKEDESIQTGSLDPVFNYTSTIATEAGINMTPQLLLEEENINCFDGNFDYEFRFKGSMAVSTGDGTLIKLESCVLKIVTWDGVGDIFTNGVVVDSFDTGIVSPGFEPSRGGDFDHTFSGNIALVLGTGFYGYLDVEENKGVIGGHIGIVVNFEPETTVSITARKLCPSTETKSYLIHEALSRVSEAITDYCVRVKSEYYGRIDSQPFNFDQDGCGGLRMLTSGLKIRRAPEDKFFASMKDLIDGLNAIDNIGFGIEEDAERAGKLIMRVEDVGYFYQDTEVMIVDAIPEASEETQEAWNYSKVLVGYKKWEVEEVNGLGEYNSNREYRTSLATISSQKEITSSLVAGGYAIEITRQQGFAESGAADTQYDNETFIICLTRLAYLFQVEQGIIASPANIFDPATAYNFRITPLRNLMRWYKSIANSYPSLGGTDSKLFFTAGTGNLTATGEIIEGIYDPVCKLESTPISENQDLFVTNFARQEDYTPLWKNETVTFEYQLSVKEWRTLKANPYGYISFQCGNGEFEKAFIQEIKFKLTKGTANFTLKKKWTQ